ncbi:ADP-ribosyltransferase [Streptomyces clavuligerus]|uniref:Mono-ADP-ribosyltransferase C3, Vip2-like protein n=1 Tax=Streptomyces clavuligerus TaxID=1901 RepID=B5GMP1_STRCL|nr:ADP-ribosyltransferase [Streptomyces clavuligerus]ANW22437.1 ADP-ribosyltransferase [Streptomyces clavuligerus]AXU17021.1 ADP-ribosyltransferase [Streptomyces clavuligerus]AXU17341.1 ADP-ribosyltransferase [Streptomyces clavuligerus]EDY47587.1 hypothetical protein SSCG_00615 [Streptomyces clavuligerus]EFG04545.1 mono-ADP-ribosyltransferase C3, Vip2-like protein [Streptomyces clavuligerus]
MSTDRETISPPPESTALSEVPHQPGDSDWQGGGPDSLAEVLPLDSDDNPGSDPPGESHEDGPDGLAAAVPLEERDGESEGEGVAGEGEGREEVDDSGLPLRPEEEQDRLPLTEQRKIALSGISRGTVAFGSDQEAVEYAQDHWNPYVESLPVRQKEALREYTSEHVSSDSPPTADGRATYVEINGTLRGDASQSNPRVQENIRELDAVVNVRPTAEPMIVTRGTGLGHLNMDMDELVGEVIEERGYMSTSVGSSPPESFSGREAITHLRVPEGTPAVWVEKVGEFGSDERELLLARGLKYQVESVVMDQGSQGPRYFIYAEIVNPVVKGEGE